ncbi:MAG: hypothetical protein G01um10147_703 [Microgenomates group bacterium Gr01-1014_7]|nr:MAG: hypothetical protein G01um10147_703 [Microgenomates group bacterium Gr01-1014_7]
MLTRNFFKERFLRCMIIPHPDLLSMSQNRFVKLLTLCIAIVLLFMVYSHVLKRTVSEISLILWLGSLLLFVWVLKEGRWRLPKLSRQILFDCVLLTLISTLFLLPFSLLSSHFHYDEHITAYTSFSLLSADKIDWFGVVPAKEEWVSQFPVFYHFFQKPFLVVYPSVLMVRISTWPYTIGVVIVLYLLTRLVYTRFLGLLSALTFITLGTQLYLGSLGLLFHSSTFFFMLSLYAFTRLYLYRTYPNAVLLALSMAVCYMVYTSSYIIAPFILTFMIFSFVKDRTVSLAALYGKTLIIFFAALSPSLLYAARIDNFFMQRVNQVSLFSGTWRSQQEIFHNIDSFLSVLTAHTSDAWRSLFLPDVGGGGEYWFGHQSFFEPVGFILFLLGIIIVLYQAIRRGSMILFIFPSAIAFTFVFGVVLTIHPPPFHRWSIAYPMIGFSIAQSVSWMFFKIRRRFYPSRNFSNGILATALILFVISNVKHALSMTEKDKILKPQDIIMVSRYIRANVLPQAPIYIAAFPANAFGKELVFRTRNVYPITTTYFDYLPTAAKDNSLLVLHRPDDVSTQKVLARFPRARLIGNLNLKEYALFRLSE